ncbi:MAG: DUF2851 family protein [Bacteroidales bacterium]
MTEDFLHFIWKYRLYSQNPASTEGEEIVVVDPGRYNTDAGPDFSNARVKIGGTLWAGNVEVHLKSSDWYQHHHDEDDGYGNVILHVVFVHDREIVDRSGNFIPTLQLSDHMSDKMYRKYEYFLHNRNWIPCENDLELISPIIIKAWMERLFVERMERKSFELQRFLDTNKNSLDETFYQVLAGNFGFKLNEQPFRVLSRMLSQQLISKHRNRLMQLEALYFGTAGLLNREFKDEYPNALKQEFRFLRNKYSLPVMEGHLWKFLRLRPSNFPTIRISQFAALQHQHENLFSKILETENHTQIQALFDVKASPYWDTHYTFDKPSARREKHLGKHAAQVIIINTVVQFLFLYGKIKSDSYFQDKAVGLLIQLAPEVNYITSGWKKSGIRAENAFESQALLELKNSYCNLKKCLHCGIGMSLLKMNA